MTFEHAFHVRLHPGAAAEYRRLHAPVPAAVAQQLAAASITGYSIFLDDPHLFGHFTYEDPECLRRVLSSDPDPEWTQAVVALMAERPVDAELPVIRGIEQVFSLGSRAGATQTLRHDGQAG